MSAIVQEQLLVTACAVRFEHALSDRLKLLQALFHDWRTNNRDFLRTSLYQEAERKTSEESKGKQKMISYKALKEKFGKRNAERIRDNKKQLEQSRDHTKESRPHWFKHPDAAEDPATG